jgi:pilus assembly protein FimV
MVPLAAGGLLALLAGLALYKVRQRRKVPQVDSSFLESRLQPDSFFGASGGQRVDTNDSSATGSSMVYSPSQLDAAGDVDPVAEADVYLAYGRDMQAEEILKEAIRTNPSRVAVQVKLMEIYAKRRDVKAFEAVASDAYTLTRGVGLEWDQICALGRDLDPGNGLYQPGGQPGSPSNMATVGMSAMTQPPMAKPDFASSSAPVDLELDLDFSADPAPSMAPAPRMELPVPTLPPEPPAPFNDRSGQTTASMQASDSMLDSLPVDLDFDPIQTTSPARSNPQSASLSPSPLKSAESDGLLEFDLGSLSLDLEETTRASTLSAGGSAAGVSTKPGSLDSDGLGDDPLATKLALAEEFFAIGDSDGARALVEEVVSEASGALKAKAERFLTELV